ncbi:hypothetical protein OBBRIDRAFT_490954 [Obba rivulosa]|uniref:Secreted protein n=1 Tax=Obba rivulosa TaxID=1052685 RepID=A0A8E2ANC8_9APHY|nr:hypothetical protein OBBRIDRAFT_490954 [Obba rivulosa]
MHHQIAPVTALLLSSSGVGLSSSMTQPKCYLLYDRDPKLYAHLHQCRRQGTPVHPCSQHPRHPRDHLRGVPLQDWLGLVRKVRFHRLILIHLTRPTVTFDAIMPLVLNSELMSEIGHYITLMLSVDLAVTCVRHLFPLHHRLTMPCNHHVQGVLLVSPCSNSRLLVLTGVYLY